MAHGSLGSVIPKRVPLTRLCSTCRPLQRLVGGRVHNFAEPLRTAIALHLGPLRSEHSYGLLHEVLLLWLRLTAATTLWLLGVLHSCSVFFI